MGIRQKREIMRNTLTVAYLTVIAVVANTLAAQAGQNGPKAAQDTGREHYVSPWKTPWTYEGAAQWSKLDPQYALCNHGKEQSPIDIRSAKTAKLPPLRFGWRLAPLRYVVNNGHTIRVNYKPGNGNFLMIGDKRYELAQFHFHHRSEERVDGRSWPMETHLMYRSADGSVSGVAAFIQPGAANPTVQQVFDHMPQHEGEQAVSGVEFSPSALVPATRIRAYDEYMGSVTAPPCTEGVRWFVLKDTVALSPHQIAAFAALYPNDARVPQPLNGRVVQQNR
jgi:carbonic anhydrase